MLSIPFSLFVVTLVLVSFGADTLSQKTCECNETKNPEGKRKKICDPVLTMSAYEFLRVVNSISRSGDLKAQNAFDACNAYMLPKKVQNALYKCSTKIVGHSCGPAFYSMMAGDPILIVGIHDCISGIVKDYTPEEIDQQLAYENCFRNIKVGCVDQE